MLNIKRKLLVGTVAMSLLGGMYAVQAIETDTINEKWGKPTVVYGGGLSDDKINETAKLFAITNRENVHVQVATGEDLINYLGSGDGDSSSMISSVMVQKRNKGQGVSVKILTPQNITLITPEQYSNAAITAGVSDVDIEVASVSKVTGESALTGVYKAFAANGEKLDEHRTAVAQQELETTNTIAQANEGVKGFSSEKLDQAMIDIKKELAELKQKTGQLATKDDIEKIIMEALKRHSLDSVINQNQINQIINFAVNYQQTDAINSTEVLNQLSKLSDTVTQKVSNLVDQAQKEGWFDKIVQFFQDVFQSITKLFQ